MMLRQTLAALLGLLLLGACGDGACVEEGASSTGADWCVARARQDCEGEFHSFEDSSGSEQTRLMSECQRLGFTHFFGSGYTRE